MQHEYLRDTQIPIYKECVCCNSRTQFTCVKCGYCYSCHWKTERVESESSSEIFPTPTRIVEQRLAGKRMATDVHGHQIEAICNYHTCSHKFSLHGQSGSKCKCPHPLNYALWKSVPK